MFEHQLRVPCPPEHGAQGRVGTSAWAGVRLFEIVRPDCRKTDAEDREGLRSGGDSGASPSEPRLHSDGAWIALPPGVTGVPGCDSQHELEGVRGRLAGSDDASVRPCLGYLVLTSVSSRGGAFRAFIQSRRRGCDL